MRLLVPLAFALLGACASPPERPRTEDDARQLAPLPACFLQLTQGSGGATVSLREEQIWPLVFPGFDAKQGTLGPDAQACNGRKPLKTDALAGGTPAKITEGSIAMGGGGDRLKAAWLRALDFPDGTSGGALVLLRTVNGTSEVYAIGSYRGRPNSMFTVERIGAEVAVVGLDDGCKGHKPGAACATTARVYRPRLGLLDHAATIFPERITYANDSEPGVRGKIEYRLSSSIQFLDGGIRVLEQVLVKDEQARELRKAEQERSFTFAPGSPEMVVDEDSLWSRVAPGAAQAKTTNAKPPPPSKEDDGGRK